MRSEGGLSFCPCGSWGLSARTRSSLPSSEPRSTRIATARSSAGSLPGIGANPPFCATRSRGRLREPLPAATARRTPCVRAAGDVRGLPAVDRLAPRRARAGGGTRHPLHRLGLVADALRRLPQPARRGSEDPHGCDRGRQSRGARARREGIRSGRAAGADRSHDSGLRASRPRRRSRSPDCVRTLPGCLPPETEILLGISEEMTRWWAF
jgi:hypothetical protein